MHRSSTPSAEREPLTLQQPTAVGIIPARLRSTRLPEKPLQDLNGAPLIVRVLERVRRATALREIRVATDSPRIAEVIQASGGIAVLTGPDLPSGLDRVAEAARDLRDDIVVNVQGDEPFVSAEGLDRLVAAFRDPRVRMATLAAPFPAGDDPADPNKVKVVVDREGRALYFSRSLIPSGAEPSASPLLHVGVYAYRRETLFELARLGPCPLERAERLEQLRALWNGIPVHVIVGEYGSVGIDTPEDLERARRLFGVGREGT